MGAGYQSRHAARYDRTLYEGEDGGEIELKHSNAARFCRSVPITRQRSRDVFPWMQAVERTAPGRYCYRSESVALAEEDKGPPSPEEVDEWQRFFALYERLVPIAEDGDIKLAMHPSDAPFPDTPLGSLGYHRVIDAFPSKQVGYLYCCGTRAQAGGSPLVLDELHNYGRKGRLFMIHLRNVRGSLATAGGFEEVLLDDGDMNPAKILLELRRVGFDGINPDHIPTLEGDEGTLTKGMAYSVGYLKALLRPWR